MASDGPDSWVAVGRVLKVHGLQGEVAVEVLTDFPDRFAPGKSLQLRTDGGEAREVRIAAARPHKGRLLVRFEGVDGPEAAETLKDQDLCVLPGDLPARPAGYFFHWELRGFAVVDRSDAPLGTVVDLVDAAGLPLLVVRTPSGDREVPFRAPLVVSADRDARRLVLDPPPGLLD